MAGGVSSICGYTESMIRLDNFPIRYEELNDLYEHTDQSFCLNRVAVPLDEDTTRGYFFMVRSGFNDGMLFGVKGIFLDGKLIGKIERTVDETGCAEIDLIIKKEYCGKGYGSEALKQFLALPETLMECSSYCAYIDAENKAAERVFEKNGFEAKRKFSADVVTPQGSTYVLRTVTGTEYIRGGTSE